MPNDKDDFEYRKWLDERNRATAERAHDTETDFGNRANQAASDSGSQAIRA